MAKKQDIKDEIAHLLMRNSVGMIENAVIQQVTATSNVDAIAIALKEMASLGEVKLDGKRWKITPVGRSFYSDMNNEKKSQLPEAADKLVAGMNNVTEAFSSAVSRLGDKVPQTNIERIESFRTSDGEIHSTQAAAEQHLFRQQLLPQIDEFIKSEGLSARQKGIIISHITRWEGYKREKAA